MLEKQLDDLALLGKRSLASRGGSSLLAEKEVKEEDDILKKLVTRLSDLEGQINKQSNLLDNLDVKCKQLLEQNSIYLQKLDNASSSINNLQCANKGTAYDLAISDRADSSHLSASKY